MHAEQAIVEPLLLRLRARRALDVGTGTGRYLPILASTGAAVVGVDRSWAMLTRSKAASTRKRSVAGSHFRTRWNSGRRRNGSSCRCGAATACRGCSAKSAGASAISSAS
ncbi:MAG: hypothetical protein DMG03_19160 [Acidobacteria bacterium]|nr:MAG: hypothetical protein DMG03_19160 [Acidobacteriota bacterium]